MCKHSIPQASLGDLPFQDFPTQKLFVPINSAKSAKNHICTLHKMQLGYKIDHNPINV